MLNSKQNIDFFPLKVMCLNAQGLPSKYAQLFDLLYYHNPDILAITESFLDNDILDPELQVPGYVLFRKDRNLSFYPPGLFTNEARGGIIIYIKDLLNPVISDLNNVKAEFLWINIHPTKQSELLLGVCYRPEAAGSAYVDTICSSINEITNQDVLILGDFNFRDIDWETFT